MKRFDISIEGVTTDTVTNLVWTRAYAAESEVTFAAAESAVAELNEKGFMGFFDWRLPTMQELFGLVDHSRYAPAIDTDAFETDGKYDWVWTSTPYAASSSGYVWVVDFLNGLVGNDNRSDSAFVRAVRGASPAGQ